MYVDVIHVEMINAIIHIVINLDEVDHTTGLYIPKRDHLLVMRHAGHVRNTEIPNTLVCRDCCFRPGDNLVLVAPELDDKDMIRINVVCGAALSQKNDLRKRGHFLQGRTQETRLRPNHAHPGYQQERDKA